MWLTESIFDMGGLEVKIVLVALAPCRVSSSPRRETDELDWRMLFCVVGERSEAMVAPPAVFGVLLILLCLSAKRGENVFFV